jgi:DNA polymerase III delta prime subunit
MIGYGDIIDKFKKLVIEDKLSHAYLFFGGDERNRQEKFVFALSLANFLENGVFEKQVQLLRDTLIVLPKDSVQEGKKENIGIDEIRFLKYFLWQKPTNSIRRVTIIKEAEILTPEAQNAALKIVEEPPESALIIFITNSEDSLFPTLNSRLQKIYFPNQTRLKTRRTQINAGNTNVNLLGHLQESTLSDYEIEWLFENLIDNFRKESIKNSQQLKEILKRLTLIKQFNTNKRLQLRALISKIQ